MHSGLSLFIKIVLTATGLAPVLLVYAVVAFVNSNNIAAIILLVSAVTLVLFCALILRSIMYNGLPLIRRIVMAICAGFALMGLIYAAAVYGSLPSSTTSALYVIAPLSLLLCVTIFHSPKTKDGINPNASAPEEFRICGVEPADRESTATILIYLMPLFTSEFNDLNWCAWIPLLLFFLGISLFRHNVFYNPLLIFFGWHFYKVGTPENVAWVLISKRTILVGDRTITGIRLSNYVILDTVRK